MLDILTQPAARLDRSRAITLLDPTVERRNRRWGAQLAEEEAADAADTPSAVRPSAALSNGSRNEGFRRGTGMGFEPDSARISEGSLVGSASGPAYQPGIGAPAGGPGEVPGVESRLPELGNVPELSPVGTRPVVRGPGNKPEERPSPPGRTSAAQPPVRMAGFPEACVEQPLASGGVPGRAAEAGFPKAAPGSELAANRSRTVGRAGARAHGGSFEAVAAALTTPVQILSKPCPRYPEEALRRGLQGDVLLDVEFRYSGAVEVLGVRRGLGHGLNESAIEATRKMRFVPARRDGRPVDTQATLRIRFQLLQ